MERFEPFDLKITKLTGGTWDRADLRLLAYQLMERQGNPRHSIENRIVLLFDKSPTSRVEFFERNKDLIMEALISIANNPYDYTYWLDEFYCWTSIKVFDQREYQIPDELIGEYYEHDIGLRLRELEKAKFETKVIEEVSPLCGFRIRPNKLNPKEIGIDGELKIDSGKLRTPKYLKQLELKWV